MVRVLTKISNFTQLDIETMLESWECFKELMRKCKDNGTNPKLQLTNFWDGFTSDFQGI